jgi:hypothetical protein
MNLNKSQEILLRLDDSPSHDFAADLLDFVAGWCSLQNSIW